MATDLTRLAAALAGYETTLRRNRQQVGEAFADLERRFGSLSAVYEGAGATEFKGGWSAAADAFTAYVDGVPSLLQLLTDKSEQVRRADEGL